MADLAVLEHSGGDPHALLGLGPARLARLIGKAWGATSTVASVPPQWLVAARAALALYDDHPAVALADLAAEVQTEVRLLKATQAELDRHATQREYCYRWVDPRQLARSLPVLAEIRRVSAGRHHGPQRGVEAAAFADLSAYTKLTEEAEDDVAANLSLTLAPLVNEVAAEHRGEGAGSCSSSGPHLLIR